MEVFAKGGSATEGIQRNTSVIYHIFLILSHVEHVGNEGIDLGLVPRVDDLQRNDDARFFLQEMEITRGCTGASVGGRQQRFAVLTFCL